MMITYGSAGEPLARATANILGYSVLNVKRRLFPDGEQYLRLLGDFESGTAAVFQPLFPSPDSLFIELALIADALRGVGCKKVIGVLPYVAYLRQDERFIAGEPLSAKLIARLIEAAGIDSLIAVDMHLHRYSHPRDLFRIEARNISAMPLLAKYYREKHPESDPLVVGPDAESHQWASSVASILKADFVVLEKERLGDREVRVSEIGGINGREVVIVDDMVSTGKTLVEVVSRLKAEGASRVDAIVSHALLVEDAYRSLKMAGLSDLIASDTIPSRHSQVSVAPLIAAELKGAFP